MLLVRVPVSRDRSVALHAGKYASQDGTLATLWLCAIRAPLTGEHATEILRIWI